MASSTEQDVTITARCLCKANIFKVEVSQSELPLHASVCHCDSCRHMTGALYSVDLRWPAPKADVDVSKLKVFHFSPRIDLLFCPTCSSPMFFASAKSRKDEYLGVFTGVLDNQAANLVTFDDHIFIHDTLDGGASVWLKHNTNGSKITRFAGSKESGSPEEVPDEWPEFSQLTGYEAKKEDAIPIRCKCKGVDLVLHRGDYTNVEESDLPVYIDPKTHKLAAILCACDSCRLQSGIDVMCWTYSEMRSISFSGNSDKLFPTNRDNFKQLVDDRDPDLGTLAYYSSSPGAERYSCSNCSACIFFASESRPHAFSIAVGSLEASDGARAEGLLSWSYGPTINAREDADGGWREGLLDNIEKDGEEYRIVRDYPKYCMWRRRST